jgi:hypothetical protein
LLPLAELHDGYWFNPESEQLDLEAADYGTTISTPEYVNRQISKHLRAPIAYLEEGYWWEHQDVYVVAKD